MHKDIARISILLSAAALATACRSSNTGTADAHTTADSPPGTFDAPPGTPDAAGATGCNNVYAQSTIASMRQGASGCYELDNVVAIALTPSKSSPYLYVQDAGGGNFSAIRTHCSSTSTQHPCTVAAAVSSIPDGENVTVKGLYTRSKSTGYEIMYIDSITDNGAGTMPTAATATLGDISRAGTNTGLAFQRVTATIPGNDPLVMYDWTPPEFANTTATKCPYQFAFGMIPKSANATATAACSGTTSQPAGQTSPNGAEILIGTDFYKGFTVSSDCRCAAMYSDKEPTATSQIIGTIGGVLIFDVPFGQTTGYYYLAPKSITDANVTKTQ